MILARINLTKTKTRDLIRDSVKILQLYEGELTEQLQNKPKYIKHLSHPFGKEVSCITTERMFHQ